MRSLLRPAAGAAAILLLAAVVCHQAGRIDLLRVRGTLAIVTLHRGLAYVSPTGVEWPELTFAAQPRLLEGRTALGPGDSRLGEIRSLGNGRYRFVGNSLYFSSSDGTDPRLNGRMYHFDGPWPLSRRAAVLVYLLLGSIAALTLRPWIWASLRALKAAAAHIVQITTADAAAGAAADQSSTGFAHLDGTPLRRWETLLVVALAVGLAFGVVERFLSSPSLGSIMLEYGLKSIPLFADGSASSMLDFNGAGDPRGRVVNSFFTWVNVRVRKELLLKTAIHPALSISWLLYPLALVVLFGALRRLCGGSRYAVIATLLYAASPGMLDTLLDYHLPGKALVNFWFASSLYGVSLLEPAGRTRRSVPGVLVLGAVAFLGLLSDETAVFIPVSICLLFGYTGNRGLAARRIWLVVVASFVAALGAYGTVVLVAVPLSNALLQQAPLDLPASVVAGPYASMFGMTPRDMGNTMRFYDPLGLLHTIVSAHFIPGRLVEASWTMNQPYPRFWRWPLPEQFTLLGVLLVIGVLIRFLRAECRAPVVRIALAFAIYVVCQSLSLIALSGYVCESSYYAALASLFVALFVAAIATGCRRNPVLNGLSWALVTFVMTAQFANLVATARRHPYLGPEALGWAELQAIRARIERGDTDAALAEQPFPSRRFLYAFEVAAAFDSVRGRPIDFRPMAEPQSGLVRHLDVDRVADPNIVPLAGSALPFPRATVDGALLAKPIDPSVFHAGVIRGQTGVWGYQLRFDGTGQAVQRSWRFGLMRLWSATGRVERRGSEVCFVFATRPDTCVTSLYQDGDWMVALAADGRPVTWFTWVN
jgi:hypothetical protein